MYFNVCFCVTFSLTNIFYLVVVKTGSQRPLCVAGFFILYFSLMKCKFSHVGHLFVLCGDVFSYFILGGWEGQGGDIFFLTNVMISFLPF